MPSRRPYRIEVADRRWISCLIQTEHPAEVERASLIVAVYFQETQPASPMCQPSAVILASTFRQPLPNGTTTERAKAVGDCHSESDGYFVVTTVIEV